jgi:hypothetical protein
MKNQNLYKLITIFIVGLAFRFICFPFDIQISTDAFDSFVYASKLTQESQLPYGFNTANTGWQYFLSIFFSNSNFDEPLNLMNIQRTLSIIISASIIFPLYVLLRKFFEEKFALLGCILFIFEPRFLLSSLLGINYPFFILLSLTSLVAFLQNQKNLIFVTFVCLAIGSLVRVESILFIPLFATIYIIKNHSKKDAIRLTLSILIIVIILLPISTMRIEANGEDGLISQFVKGPTYVSKHVIGDTPDVDDAYYNSSENKLLDFTVLAISNSIKFFGLSLAPYMIIFFTVGIFFILKNKKYRDLDYEKLTIILFSIVIIIPAFYAYGRGISEIRYLFGLLPIFCIIGTYGIYILASKINRKNIISFSAIGLVIVLSLIFVNMKIPDYEYERASYLISTEILKRTNVVNNFHGDWHLKSAHLINNWPNLPEVNQYGKYSIIVDKVNLSENGEFEDFFIFSKDKKLEYLVISDKDDMNELKESPYLIEEFNTLDHGYKHKLQIFKIENTLEE